VPDTKEECQLAQKIADRASYFLSSETLRTRLLAVETLDFAVRALSIEALDAGQPCEQDDGAVKLFLPTVHRIWPALCNCFRETGLVDADPRIIPLLTRALTLVGTIAEVCADFVAQRFQV
jgi:hypothetical protein